MDPQPPTLQADALPTDLCSAISSEAKTTVQVILFYISTITFLYNMDVTVDDLKRLDKAIRAECIDNNAISLTRHLPGKSNVHTGHRLRLKIEWRLQAQVLPHAGLNVGTSHKTGSANSSQQHMPSYKNRYYHQNAKGADVLAHLYNDLPIKYVSPAYRLIPRVLQTTVPQKASAEIRALLWPA